jgi:hypothetical protein
MHDPTSRCPKCQGEVRLEDLSCRACGKVIRTQPLLGEVLIDEKVISREQLENALKLQQRKLGEILIETGACKAEDLDRAVHIQKQGRTRAELYAADLQRARMIMVLLVVVVAMLGAGLVHSRRQAMFRDRVEREELSLPEANEIMQDTQSPYKFEALKSVARNLSNPSAVGVIQAALKSDKWYVRLYAAMLAKETRNQAFVPPLIQILDDSKKEVAAAAHQALTAITNQNLEPSSKDWVEWAKGAGLPVEAPAKGDK